MSTREWYPAAGSTWHVQVGVDWNESVSTDGMSITLTPQVLRWDSESTDNYGSRYWETLSPDYVGAGSWSGLRWGSGSGTRVVDTFAARTYSKGASAYTVTLTVGWDSSFGTWYSGSFHYVGSRSKGYEFTIPAAPTPNPPTNLTYTRSTDNRVNISWTASSSHKTKVLVERMVDGGQWAQIASLSASATSYADTTTSADHTYSYRVRVTNGVFYSSYATSATVITMAPAAPTAITLARATGTDVAVTLENNTKTATSLAWEKQEQGSTVWVSGGENVPGKVTSFTAAGMQGIYRIHVKNVNAIGSSAWLESEYITTICAPNPPTLLEPIGVFNMASGTITFKWLHNAIDGSAQTAAKLQYKVNSGSWSDEISVTTAQEYSIAASTFNAGDKITWRVKTKGAYEDPQHEPPIDGYSSYSSEKSFNVYQVPSLSFVPNKPPSPSDNPPYVTEIPIPCEVTYSDPQNMDCASATVALYDGQTLMFSEPMDINSNTLTASLTADEFVPENGKSYTVVVTARSGSTLQATVSTTFTVSYTEPKRATVQISNDADTGHVTLLVEPQGDTAATGNPAIIGGVYSNWHMRSVEFDGSCEVSDGQVVTTCGAGSGTGANLTWPAVDVEVAGADIPTLYHDALNRTYAAGINGVHDTVSLSATASTITRRIGCVDLGSLTWEYEQGETPRFYTTGIQTLVKCPSESGIVSNLLCAIYTAAGSYTDDMTMYVDTSGILSIHNSGYQNAAAFKTAMSGKLLYYELAQSQTINLTERLADGVSIEAEGGGTVAFESESGFPVPNEMFFKVYDSGWSTASGTSPAQSVSVPSNGRAVEICKLGGHTEVSGGQLVNAVVTNIKSKDGDNETIASFEITQAIRNACPCYGASAGSAYNYIDFERRVYVQNVGSVDLGTIDFDRVSYSGVYFFRVALSGTKQDNYSVHSICAEYETITSALFSNFTDNKIRIYNTNLQIRDDSYTDAAAFKTAMDGVMLYYELQTPVEVDLSTMLPAKSTLPQPTASVSLESALPTSITATAGYDGPDYTSIQVYRVSDHRQLLMDGAVAGQSLIDRYAPLNTEYTYEVITRAQSGAIAVNSIANVLKTNRWFAYWGTNIASARWTGGGEDRQPSRPDRVRIHYPGRKSAVSYDSDAIDETTSVKFHAFTKSESEAFMKLIYDGGHGVFKTGNGRVFNADFELSQHEDLGDFYHATQSFTAIKTEGPEL